MPSTTSVFLLGSGSYCAGGVRPWYMPQPMYMVPPMALKYVSLHVHFKKPQVLLLTTLCVSGDTSAYVRRNACCTLCLGMCTAALLVSALSNCCGRDLEAVAKPFLLPKAMALLSEANGLARALDAMMQDGIASDEGRVSGDVM